MAGYFSIFSPDAVKYGLEKLRIRTLFTQWQRRYFSRTEQQVKFTNDGIDCNNHDKEHINLNKHRLRWKVI